VAKGNKNGGKSRPWTEDEETQLAQLWSEMSSGELAPILDRSPQALKTKAMHLGLKSGRKPNAYRPDIWLSDELEFLRQNYQIMSYAEIGKALGRTKAAVDHKASDLKLVGRSPMERAQRQEDSTHWRGGTYTGCYTRLWMDYVRPSVFERDNWMCLECGLFSPGMKLIVAHHIIPARLTRDNRISNHATLCRTCHYGQKAHDWTDFSPQMLKQLPEYQRQILEAA
jgi:hypothetical protein